MRNSLGSMALLSFLSIGASDCQGPSISEQNLNTQARAAFMQFRGELDSCVDTLRTGAECTTSLNPEAYAFIETLSKLKPYRLSLPTAGEISVNNERSSASREYVYTLDSSGNRSFSEKGEPLICSHKWKITLVCTQARKLPDGCKEGPITSVNPEPLEVCPPFGNAQCSEPEISEPEIECTAEPIISINY